MIAVVIVVILLVCVIILIWKKRKDPNSVFYHVYEHQGLVSCGGRGLAKAWVLGWSLCCMLPSLTMLAFVGLRVAVA